MNIKTYFKVGLIAIIGITAITLSSCKDKKGATPLDKNVYGEDELTVELPDNQDVVEIPFTENNGNLYVKAIINNSVNADMVFDTGASDILVGKEEVDYLYSKGIITDEDVLGQVAMQDASNGITPGLYILLKQIQIGDLSVENVKAMVVNKPGLKMLFGQSALQLLPSYTIDNENKVIRFNLKSSE